MTIDEEFAGKPVETSVVELQKQLEDHGGSFDAVMPQKFYRAKIWKETPHLNLSVIVTIGFSDGMGWGVLFTPENHFGYIPNGSDLYERFSDREFANEWEPLFNAQGFLLLTQQVELLADTAVLKEGKILQRTSESLIPRLADAKRVVEHFKSYYIPV